ncbi:flagellar filament capping protein FliD [uncultured Ralstonia sp.]|jgi:flagellar hook-associated protein 2|uniref:flagellar filament capping protein FliD n=1 Tax=Ralstonia sp. TaxID=54061 RepID=UPI0025DF5504|nr:flagellar filament capping protein FliD [uncultured Ralstonia sp.]
MATTSTSSNYVPQISIPGIGTSIDVNTLVSKLMQVEGRPLKLHQDQQKSYQTQLSAVGTLKSALSTFQTALANLVDAPAFSGMKVSGHDTSVLNATVTSAAPTGTYAVKVTQLAQSQVLSAQGQASNKVAIGSGTPTTISFAFGAVSGGTFANGKYSGATFTQNGNLPGGSVTINASNNTLSGIRDAINAAKLGVSASIVNDGSGTPYRLALTSNAGGASSAMKISVSGDAALSSLLAHDPAGAQNLTEVTTGQNALATINGIAVQSTTNTLSNVIDGTSFTLSKTGSTTVTVGGDGGQASTSVLNFVKAYNALRIQFNALTKFDTANPTNNGALAGDVSTKALINQVTDVFGRAIGNGSYQSLGSIGITMDADGTLSINDKKLDAAIFKSSSQVAGLFAGTGTATDALVKVSSFSKATQAGSYAINVTQLATQGSLQGSAAANTTIQSGVNDGLSVTLSGITTSINVPAGTYTASSLAAHIQSLINASPALQKAKTEVAVATDANGVLTLTDKQFGAISTVSVSGNGAASLLGGSPMATAGREVQGTINGAAAAGSGQNLYGTTGTAAEGLTVQVSGGAVGARGSVTVQRGYAAQLHTVMGTLLSSNGMVQNATDAINSSLNSVANQITRMQRHLDSKQALYYAQFNALSQAVASMTNTSNYLATQLAALQKQTRNR